MKHISRIAILFAAASLSLAANLHAQEHVVRAKVPFEFSVGNTMFPSGDYRITQTGAFLHIENENTRKGAYVIASGTDPSTDGKSRLVFNRADSTYFLRKLTSATSAQSREVSLSKEEHRAQLADAGAHAVSRGR